MMEEKEIASQLKEIRELLEVMSKSLKMLLHREMGMDSDNDPPEKLMKDESLIKPFNNFVG